MAGGNQVKMIDDRIAELEAERQTIDVLIAELKQMHGKMNGSPAKFSRPRAQRSSVKSLVIELLEAAGAGGLNAADTVEIALMEKGEKLDRSTVSSLLSRLKNEGVAFYDGKKYRLKRYEA